MKAFTVAGNCRARSNDRQVIATLQKIELEIATLQKEDSVIYRAIRYQLMDLSAPIFTMVLNTMNYNRGLRLEAASA